MPDPTPATRLPHSRACGPFCRGHGLACSPDCPTCHGRPWPAPDAEVPTKFGPLLQALDGLAPEDRMDGLTYCAEELEVDLSEVAAPLIDLPMTVAAAGVLDAIDTPVAGIGLLANDLRTGRRAITALARTGAPGIGTVEASDPAAVPLNVAAARERLCHAQVGLAGDPAVAAMLGDAIRDMDAAMMTRAVYSDRYPYADGAPTPDDLARLAYHGVTFTEEEQTRVQRLVDSGTPADLAQAQRLILAKVDGLPPLPEDPASALTRALTPSSFPRAGDQAVVRVAPTFRAHGARVIPDVATALVVAQAVAGPGWSYLTRRQLARSRRRFRPAAAIALTLADAVRRRGRDGWPGCPPACSEGHTFRWPCEMAPALPYRHDDGAPDWWADTPPDVTTDSPEEDPHP